MSQQTKNMAAILPAIATPLVIEERPTPIPGPGEILVRNHAIAVNPVDWKRQAWGFAVPSYPVILGSDICGIVVSVGPSVIIFKPGDRVIGYADSFMSGNNNHAAFQTYTIVSAASTAKLPNSMSFEKGVILPMATATASIILFNDLDLPLPTGKYEKKQDSAILVWGGSSSVGSMAIQLASLLGFTVYATASEIHHKYLESLGATKVFDYRSPTVVDDIVHATKSAGKPISYAIDAISEVGTLKPTLEVLSLSGGKGSKLAHLLPWPESETKPDEITLSNVSGERIWGGRKDISNWLFHDFLTQALEKDMIVPSPEVQVVDGGLGGLQTAMDLLKDGVSGKKLVVKLD